MWKPSRYGVWGACDWGMPWGDIGVTHRVKVKLEVQHVEDSMTAH